jgi:hypothetical protein
MSWATCYSGSNNIHSDFPPLMSDGRLYANFDPACKANDYLKNQLNLQSNYDYRQYLINNGNNIIKNNKKNAQFSCGSPILNYNSVRNTNNKYLYKGLNDKTQPFGYEHSDLKNIYLSRQRLQHNSNAPIMTQEQLLLYKSQ